MSLTWYLRSRGTAPERDYTWSEAHGTLHSPTQAQVASASKDWASPTSPTFVVRSVQGAVTIYASGLRNSSWPRDYQGREITASLVIVADGPDIRRAVTAAARLMRAEPPEGLLSFDLDRPPGWTASEDVIYALLDEPADAGIEALAADRIYWTKDPSEAASGVQSISRAIELGDVPNDATLAVVSELLTPDTARTLDATAMVLCSSQLPSRSVGRPKVSSTELPPRPTMTWLLPVMALLLGVFLLWWLLRRK
jgi:hypothetical protein